MPEVFQGTPAWYSGDNSVLKRLIEETIAVSKRPYEKYSKNRLAPQQERQARARELSQNVTSNPNFPQMFDQGRGALGRTSNINTYNTVNPYIQNATQSPVQGIQEYMNPYQQNVLGNMANLVNRNLRENILPSIQGRMLASGSKWGRGREDLQQRAIRDANEGLARESGNFLHKGYDQALQARLSNQQANLQGGLGLGSAQARDAEQQSQAAQGLGNLATQEQAHGLRGADVMNQLGAQDQAQDQANKNIEYQDFINQQDYPMRQLAFASEQTRGLQPSVTSSFAPAPQTTPFQSSPWTAGAGLLGTATGLMGMNDPNQQQRRQYAQGGRVEDIMDNENIGALQQHAENFQQPNVNPQASAMTRLGLGLMANAQPTAVYGPGGHLQVNPEGGAFKALGKAGLGAMDEYQNQLNSMDTRNRSAADIHNIINRTRQWQHKQQLSREQFENKKSNQDRDFGLRREQFNFNKERANRPSGPEIIKGPNGESYQATIDPETGKIKAVPIEGMNQVSDKRLDKEYADELKTSSGEAKAAEEIRNDYNIMKDLLPSIGPTGPIAGSLPDYVATLGGVNGDVGNRQVFQASSNRLLSTILKTQKGAQSDADMAVFATTKPGTNKTEEANKLMIEYGDKIAERAEKYNQFLLDSKGQSKSLAQAKKEWKEYVNANPIIDRKQEQKKDFVAPAQKLSLDSNPYINMDSSSRRQEIAALKAMQ